MMSSVCFAIDDIASQSAVLIFMKAVQNCLAQNWEWSFYCPPGYISSSPDAEL